MKSPVLSLAALLLLGTVAVAPVAAQVTAVPNSLNFQGRLATPSGNPIPNGTYSIRFSLWNVASGGTAAANEKYNKTLANVQVRNGVFAVALDAFPANLFNSALYLEIKVGADLALTPRQPLVTVPYAFKADSVKDGSITGASITNGTITANKFASGIFNSLAWLLGGNSGTNSASNFLGTTDNQPLAFRVNNRQALLVSYAENTSISGSEYRSINALGGAAINVISPGVIGAVIGGGGFDAFTGTDYPNSAQADFSTVSGGDGNVAASIEATVGGGFLNMARGENSTVAGGYGSIADGNFSFIGGGGLNMAGGELSAVGGGGNNNAPADFSIVAGGQGNIAGGFVSAVLGGDFNAANGTRSVVGGGNNNHANFEFTTVSGGANNFANSGFSVIAGGQGNTASGFVSSILGGDFNTAGGGRSVVLGGNSNTANGTLSLAAGYRAKAVHDGSFVWGDTTNADFASTGANQFLIRASGGFGINTNTLRGDFDLRSASGNADLYLQAGGAAVGVNLGVAGDGTMFLSNFDGTTYTDNLTLFAAGNATLRGALTQNSDARLKQNILPFGNALEAILNLRGVSYEWKDADREKGQQIGFIAQEVEKIFPELVKTDDKGYKSVNYIGVIPVLVEAVKSQQKQIAALKSIKTENATLKTQLAELMARMSQLEKAVQASQK